MEQYVYFDAVEYFQSKLDAICDALEIDHYNVSAERKLDAVNAREVVIAAMAGPVGVTTATVTYEISAYTNNPDEVMAMLNELARAESGKVFTSEVETIGGDTVTYNIIGSYMTPTVMDRDVEIGPNHGTRIVQFASFGILPDLMDISSISYKGEAVDFAQATVNYVAELSSNNKSGQSLMKSTASGAAMSISITLPPQRNTLTTDVLSVLAGTKDKNAPFSFSVVFGTDNPITISKQFIINGSTFNSMRGSIPSLQVSFAEYDGD